MNNILLIQPPVRDFYFTAKRSVPYGLISIASSLRRSGFDVELIDCLATSKSRIIETPSDMTYVDEFYGEKDLSPFALFHDYRHYGYSYQHIEALVKRSSASIIGISSLFSAYRDEAIQIARIVKKVKPGSRVVLGGHHPTAMPADVMTESSVDYAIRGEGEFVFPQLAIALKNKAPVESVPGIVYRKQDGTLYISEPAVVAEPDKIPLPASDLVNHKFYGRKNGGSAVLTASRGCPMKCSYCCVASPVSTFRKRSVDSVFTEIEFAVTEHGARFIDFEDENLTLDKRWFLEFLDRISGAFGDLGLELRAMNGLFPPSLDDETIRRMKEAGFNALNLSLCTISKDQLKRFNRPDVRAGVETAVESAARHGLDVVCYIIVGAPGQSAESSVDDLIYLSELQAIAGVSVYYPAPGSMDFHNASEKNLLPDRFSLMRSSVIPISDTTTRLESVTLLRLGRILNFIKLIRNKGVGITPKAFVSTNGPLDVSDRETNGLMLLNAFLHDGVIRGITPDGTVFAHTSSKHLTDLFINGITAF